MEAKTKRFPIENVLTVYTGYCMKQGVGIAQDVFSHLWPGIYTLTCAMKQPAAAKELERQHPGLRGIKPIEEGSGLAGCERFMSEARAIFGDTMAVDGPIPGESVGLDDELDHLSRVRR
jgi:hypothetical protein